MAESRVASISTGRLRGTVTGGVARFLGIPYAAAPFGPNRLQPPRPVQPWPGERDATRFGATAPQGSYPLYLREILPEVIIAGDDCLNLNVWAPATTTGGLPVLVWIHGGSYTNGSGSVADYDGTHFAEDGVVCVTINYRLGVEGFLAAEGGTPNRGLLDMVAALRWVRDEIAAFGGDPARVTVAGESAGAMAISALLAMPAAAGLFCGAILQSGAAAHTLSAESARRVAERVGATLGVPPTIEALAQLPPQVLVEAVTTVSAAVVAGDAAEWGELAVRKLPFGPFVDGDVLPAAPLDAIAAGASAEVRLLLCTTRDEWRLFVVPNRVIDAIDEQTLAGRAGAIGLSPQGLAAYRASRPDASPGELLSAILTDFTYRQPALALALARPAGAAPTWIARFDGVDAADNHGLGPCHTAEIPYVFGTAALPVMRPRLGTHPAAATVEIMHGAWVRFVRDGDPGWPAADRAGRPTALLGERVEVVPDPDAQERKAWS
ncbi:carboxylesterase/lipase family protein [Actinoplanes regularis]|uniref:carboxylesterase/lipase family protein n=1 Tax=Actinoplanes regularis TaxID=52697 RepID=UPI0024A09B4E|nr:carboxylesterase family protein [Actinoplanes regularis]GLW34540.1 carboxylic ester hydrolase [Actinoplanes regularis]